MSLILVLAGAWAAAAIGCEIILKSAKLQNGLARIFSVYILVGIGSFLYLALTGRLGVVACVVFWFGAFLSWFGVRSHLESSILLRMVHMLKDRRRTAAEILSEYEARYGETRRIKELYRGGLLSRDAEGAVLAPKGKWIVRIVTLLTRNPGN
jgi:hypothetical protein